MAEEHTRRTSLGDGDVEYTVRRSERATRSRIDVGLDGVTVVVPAGSDVDPASVLRHRADWVLEKRAECERHRARLPDRSHEAGAVFPYLGSDHEVVVETRSKSAVVDGELRLAAHHVEQTSVKRALEALYRRLARDRFESRADTFAPEIGVEVRQIEVRNQRTKWGSCSATGTIGLNWRLLMAPPEIVDYVVVHELCHLRVPNHSDAFWALVAEHDPAYRAHREWLEANGTRLVFSDDDL